jgi:hypothetical protein
MKLPTSIGFAALLAIATVAVNPTIETAQAGAYGERSRHQNCVQLRQSGKLRWHAIASGIIDDGGGRNGYSGFHTKSCHTSEQSCQRWVSNIYNEIRNVDSVRTAYCKLVN